MLNRKWYVRERVWTGLLQNKVVRCVASMCEARFALSSIARPRAIAPTQPKTSGMRVKSLQMKMMAGAAVVAKTR
jgi:hypothetical protein